MRKIICLLALLVSPLATVSCAKQNQEITSPTLSNCSIHHDDEFGGAYIDISIDDFNNLGFKYGDSLNLAFDNGLYDVTYKDIGYHSGYYVPAGQELVVAYPGYPNIKFCINYGEDVYAKHYFNANTTVTITLSESEKYLPVEETLSITYTDDRTQYESDEQFTNFREMTVGNLKPGLLYRGASPVDNSRSRSAIVDSLLAKNNIQYNIDLADKGVTGNKYTVHEYFQGLMDNNKVIFLGMAAAYKAEDFSNKMRTMFLSILENDGPYYIHCLEGKDRTGYVCMVIEALCGATYEELIDDYFVTYKNYYGIEKGSNKYEVIKSLHIDEMIKYVFSFNQTANLLTANYRSQANNYLLEIGLTQSEIDSIQTKLSK